MMIKCIECDKIFLFPRLVCSNCHKIASNREYETRTEIVALKAEVVELKSLLQWTEKIIKSVVTYCDLELSDAHEHKKEVLENIKGFLAPPKPLTSTSFRPLTGGGMLWDDLPKPSDEDLDAVDEETGEIND